MCSRLGKFKPFRLTILGHNVYFLQGTEVIEALFKASPLMSGLPLQRLFLTNVFGMSSKGLDAYAADNSGVCMQPHPNSNLLPRNRIDYRTHVSLIKFLSGKRLSTFTARWQSHCLSGLQNLYIGDDWVRLPDLLSFCEEYFGNSAIEALCGPLLQEINPQFSRDLSAFSDTVPLLCKGLPRWIMPRAYARRGKLLQNIRQWHDRARSNFDESMVAADGDFDPFWGSELIRSRQELLASIDNIGPDEMAASDLGLVWG